MKLKIFILSAIFFAYSQATAGMIDVTVCDARGGTATVVIANTDGKWVGFSARTSSGEIIDIPPIKKSKFGWVGGSHMFRFGANKGVTEVRSSTWKSYNKKTNLMEERIDDTGWVPCK
ncbi:hypothetical protein JWG39_02760 [Desulforhopalus vacuolatus]|uniref:hypothetical protein n=1 Tax=Desulforhopalus vacuolatus TaxID=40414 RepID=UPI0019640995|nr:hypothetical protein [Desulforhopalus vacuolatus]MBM9518739.1 hypothetical protein [Desulforhopalus vacuolatus]